MSGAETASEAGTESERESDLEVSCIPCGRRSQSLRDLIILFLAYARCSIKARAHHQQSVSSVSTAATSIDLTPSLDPSDPAYAAFASVFAHFQEQGEVALGADAGPAKGQVYYSDDEDEDEEQAERRRKANEESGMTRRERRKAAVSLGSGFPL